MLRDGGEQLTMGVFSTSTSLVREDAPRSACKYPVSSQSLTDAPDMFISIGASEGPWLRVGLERTGDGERQNYAIAPGVGAGALD